MSSTNRGSARNSFDSYPTPHWCITRLLEAVDWKPIGTWLEPCAGEGRIIQTVDKYFIDRHGSPGSREMAAARAAPFSGIRWHAWDIQRQYEVPLLQLNASVRIGDMLELARSAMAELQAAGGLSPDYPFDIVITNPPYGIAMQVLLTARLLAPVVILLLRRNFIGSAKRHPYLSQNMPDEYLLPDRPSFIWSHRYKVECDCCHWKITRTVKVPAGERPQGKGAAMGNDGAIHCDGVLRVQEVSTSTSDSAEYAWMVWTPKSGPVGSTQMLALTSKEKRATQ